jgi:hypothetical protein
MSNLLPGYTLGSFSVVQFYKGTVPIYFSPIPFIFNAIGKALALNRVEPYYTFFRVFWNTIGRSRTICSRRSEFLFYYASIKGMHTAAGR